MTAKTMAEEIMLHSPIGRDEQGQYCKACNHRYGYAADRALHQRASAHIAEVLSAAGFGLVADAKAEALEEAADELDRQERFGRLPWNDLTDEQRAEYRSWARLETNQAFLRARAAALRGES